MVLQYLYLTKIKFLLIFNIVDEIYSEAISIEQPRRAFAHRMTLSTLQLHRSNASLLHLGHIQSWSHLLSSETLSQKVFNAYTSIPIPPSPLFWRFKYVRAALSVSCVTLRISKPLTFILLTLIDHDGHFNCIFLPENEQMYFTWCILSNFFRRYHRFLLFNIQD